MNKTFALFIVGLFLLAACTSQQTSRQVVQPNEVPSQPDTSVIGSATTGQTKEFTMTAKNWEFDPSVIEVNKGDKVVIHITSTDVDHGFILPDFGVNVKLKPGETSDAMFIADKTGTFDFHCNVFCGSGHREMDGQLIVK